MKNYKLEIQYDGTDYAGWQIQNNAETVQGILVEGIKKITGVNVNLLGSGRTDAGVHALGQVANFRIEKELDIFKFQYALNSVVPDSIAVKNISEVGEEFHSRFDARKRSYYYLIAKSKSPFYNRYSYYLKHYSKIDFHKINKLGRTLLGEHDFTSFARKKTEVNNKICTLYDLWFRESNELIYFYVEANRFLHGMVRTLVGTLLESAKHDYSTEYLSKTLAACDRDAAGRAVPANGLFLYKVKY